MFEGISNGVLAVAGGIIAIAIVAVIVGQKSQAPAAITATGNSLAKIIAAAVNPVSTAATNGNNVQAFTSPAQAGNVAGTFLGGLFGG